MKPGTGIPASHAVKSNQNHPPGPLFRNEDHHQSGPYTAPVVPLFRNRAQFKPGLGSANPLLRAKLLEVFA